MEVINTLVSTISLLSVFFPTARYTYLRKKKATGRIHGYADSPDPIMSKFSS